MNNKQQIKAFLIELQTGVREKRNDLEKRINEGDGKTSEVLKPSLDYVEGQLYELGYILERLSEDRRKKTA